MKKAISLTMLAIFILSILPASLAQDQLKEQTREKVRDLVPDYTLQERERLKERLEVINEERMERLKELSEKPEWAKYNKSQEYKARVLSRIQVENARENFIRARERFETAKMNLEQAKLRFQEQLELRKTCKGEECNLTEEQLRLRAREFLGNSADAIIEHLNKVRAKIQENDDLTQEEANEMIAKIDAKIAEIQAAKEQAQNATTKEEIREAANKINAAWKNIRLVTAVHTNQLINARIGGIIVKSEHLKEKLERILVRMEENGKDVSDIQPMVDEFDEKIALAKEKYEAALEKFNEFKETEDKPEATETLREAQNLMKESKQALKEANEKLKEIVKAIRERNGQQEIEEENEAEEENETETS